MSALYTRLFSGALFPLHEQIKRHDTVAVRQHLERTQWWDRERIQDLQLDRLRALLKHAGRTVPHYQRIFAEYGFDPSSVSGVGDLRALPLLTKSDIRAAPDTFRSTQARDLARQTTGGSSGEPLVFWIGKERISHDVAAKWRATRWWGVDIGDPEVVVWGSPVELGAQDRLKAWRDRIQRSVLLPAFEMSEARVRGFVESIQQRRPRMLFGYPSALSHIAAYAEQHGQRLDNLGIQVAFVTAERLYPYQRALIARVFGCAVANGYGGRDGGFIAHECPHRQMHVTSEDIVVEIVDDAGNPLPPWVSGEIVVTHLASGDFPFIRYRTGDVGAISPLRCGCGRGLQSLASIEGRSTDFVVARDGTVMHGLALIYVVRDEPGIRAFRIVQETLELTRVMLVVDGAFEDAVVDRIVAGFQARLGDGVQIRVERVAEIPPEASGKFRYVVSHVPATSSTAVEAA